MSPFSRFPLVNSLPAAASPPALAAAGRALVGPGRGARLRGERASARRGAQARGTGRRLAFPVSFSALLLKAL